MSDDRFPGLQEVINRAVEAGLRNLYTLIPAKIVKWDADKQRADCQILIKDVTENEEENRVATSWPVVTGVPVKFIGAGGFRLTCPVSDGTLNIEGTSVKATTGSLVFSHRSLDKWLSGDGKEVDPEFDHSHALTDAVFFPGLMPFGAPWTSCPTDHMTLGFDSGKQIHLHAQTICLGDESGAEKMLLAETLLADFKSAVTTMNTILLAGTTGGPTAQTITQAAQWALTQLYIRLQANGVAYLSQQVLNK